ncbi:hypothetical protein ACFLUB_01960 [Chloroflexota bacterium]
MFDNPIIFALITYGLALVIALMVAGIITLIHWAVKSKGGETASEE